VAATHGIACIFGAPRRAHCFFSLRGAEEAHRAGHARKRESPSRYCRCVAVDVNGLHRFEQEARSAAELNPSQPFISVHDMGRQMVRRYSRLELLEETSLCAKFMRKWPPARKGIGYAYSRRARGWPLPRTWNFVHRRPVVKTGEETCLIPRMDGL